MIVVCPYDRVEAAAEKYKPTAAISLLDCADNAPTIKGIAPEQHLKLSLTMAEAEMMSMPCPNKECGRIEQIIEFAQKADWGHAVLVHCRLGISRSPAAAYIIQCALAPDRDEVHIAEEMRQLSEAIDPSMMMISVADEVLKRDGRMVNAIDNLSLAEPCIAGDILEIPFLPQAA
jgi:predicted protein tyrosine phosphatase